MEDYTEINPAFYHIVRLSYMPFLHTATSEDGKMHRCQVVTYNGRRRYFIERTPFYIVRHYDDSDMDY
jgi:hypothetical protein